MCPFIDSQDCNLRFGKQYCLQMPTLENKYAKYESFNAVLISDNTMNKTDGKVHTSTVNQPYYFVH